MKLLAHNARELLQAAEIVSTLDSRRAWTVEVKEFRAKRSNAQNRLLWAVYTAVAHATGHSPEEIHEYCKHAFLPPRVIELAGRQLEVPPSTAQQDKPEFSEYVERVQSWAVNDLGVAL